MLQEHLKHMYIAVFVGRAISVIKDQTIKIQKLTIRSPFNEQIKDGYSLQH
jgi:hypothetical protein